MVRRSVFPLAVCAALVLGLALIVHGYGILVQTHDAPLQVASGLRHLQQGHYGQIEPLHPPLSRLAIAVLPWLDGVRAPALGTPDIVLWRPWRWQGVWEAVTGLFAARGAYVHDLTLARLGLLPFFALGLTATAWLGRRLYGPVAGAAAGFAFALTPMILGHAMLATTDFVMAALAMAAAAAALWALDRPSPARLVPLAVLLGLCAGAKFTSGLFVPALLLVLLLCLHGDRDSPVRLGLVVRTAGWRGLAVLVALPVVTLWAVYGFALGPTGLPLDDLLPVWPMPHLFQGLWMAAGNSHGGWFLGAWRGAAHPLFFPALLLFKTPLPLLAALVAAAGLGVAGARHGSWRDLIPFAAIAVMVLLVVPSRVNLGLRHILPVFPVLSLAAGLVTARAWQTWHMRRTPLPGALLAVTAGLWLWLAVDVVRQSPDHAFTFNALASPDPAWVAVDSDLDWGQDLGRLGTAFAARDIAAADLVYFGTAPFEAVLPPGDWRRITPDATDWQPRDWVAVSLFHLYGPHQDHLHRLLVDHQAVATIGRSIRLYHRPDDG